MEIGLNYFTLKRQNVLYSRNCFNYEAATIIWQMILPYMPVRSLLQNKSTNRAWKHLLGAESRKNLGLLLLSV